MQRWSCSTSPPSLPSGLFSFPLYYFSLYFFFLNPFLFALPFSCPLLPSYLQPCPLVSVPLSSSYLHHLSFPFPVSCFMHFTCAFMVHNSSFTCCIWALANPEWVFTLRAAQCYISQKPGPLLYIQIWAVQAHFSSSVLYMENKLQSWSVHWIPMIWIHSHRLLQEPDWTLSGRLYPKRVKLFWRESFAFPKNGHLSESFCSNTEYWKYWKGEIFDMKKRKIFIDSLLRQLFFHFPHPDSALVWLLKMGHLHPHTISGEA